jgi:glycosyltransferase involved in cell wall biosynthesis
VETFPRKRLRAPELHGAAVHVVPSREEAWSQSAVTALALGVPVVATAVDGLPVTLADRRGLLVPPDPGGIAAGIQLVLDGGGDIDTAGGRRYAAAFEPERIARDYLTVYEQLLAERFEAAGAGVRSKARDAGRPPQTLAPTR